MMYGNDSDINNKEETNKVDRNTFEYKSSMGKLSWQQERVLLFGKSKEYLILTIIAVIMIFSLLYGLYNLYFSSEYIPSIGGAFSAPILVKILGTISAFIASLIPIGAIRVRQGSMKHDPYNTTRGLELIQLSLNISMVLLIIGAVFAGISMVLTMFINFLVSVFFIVIFGGVLYFGYRFIKKSLEVVDSIISHLQVTKSKKSFPSPDVLGLRVYLIVLLVLEVILFLSSLLTDTSTIDYFTMVYSLIVSGYGVYVCGVFDQHIHARKPIQESLYEEPKFDNDSLEY